MVSEPLIIVSLGAGVQSSSMGLMAGTGELTPMPDAGIFADTKGEPASVYKWLKWLKPQLPFPIYTVSGGSLEKASLAMHRTADGRLYSQTNIPFFTRNHDGSAGKIKFRGCTRDFKLKPLHAKQRELIQPLLKAWRAKHRDALKAISALRRWYQQNKARQPKDKPAQSDYGLIVQTGHAMPPPKLLDSSAAGWAECQADPLVISWIGISMDESSRVKPSRDPWILHRYPLIEKRITRQDCLRWMESHGYPEPPRSACVYCPFHNDAEWRRLRDDEPKEFAKAARFERRLQETKAQSQTFRTTPYLHRQLVPLTRVDLRAESDMGQLNFFQNECEGICGV